MIVTEKQRAALVYLAGPGRERASAGAIWRATGVRTPTLLSLSKLGMIYRDTRGQWHLTDVGREVLTG